MPSPAPLADPACWVTLAGFHMGTGLPLVTQGGDFGSSHWSLKDAASHLPSLPPGRQAQSPLSGPPSASVNFVLDVPAHHPGAFAKPDYTPPAEVMRLLDQ